jgi:hypothetical protein
LKGRGQRMGVGVGMDEPKGTNNSL